MKTLTILTERHPELLSQVGISLSIENSPYMALTVESIGEGPRGLPALSIAHYNVQGGDLMADPEMCFEMEIEDGRVKEFHPYYIRNDFAGLEQDAVIYQGHDADQNPVFLIDSLKITGQRLFAETWDKNLEAQGFLTVTGYAVKR
jgi:hypothetical protein